jgi:hypothetical protein
MSQVIRLELWEWIVAQDFRGNWIWGVDFNMWQILDSSNCHSPVLHGTEAQKWANVIDQYDLVDLILLQPIELALASPGRL